MTLVEERAAPPSARAPGHWEAVCRALQSEIILGRLKPRERLVEDEVMARAAATRHAVRRAFDELERLGMVARRSNRGVQVRDYTLAEVEDLYEVRECLERQAASRFPLPPTPELIESLRLVAAEHERASREKRFADIFHLNNRFHETLYAAAGNASLAEAIRHYTFATHPIRSRAFPSDELREVAIRDHWAMIEAIGSQDRTRLAALIAEHIRRPMRYYIAQNLVSG
ncbi:MAG TPA: GntR family transcriptional regulator [Roseiarcus sp.]|nr:GntR family transcriptional regulator [Roseiarcus sp.]